MASRRLALTDSALMPRPGNFVSFEDHSPTFVDPIGAATMEGAVLRLSKIPRRSQIWFFVTGECG